MKPLLNEADPRIKDIFLQNIVSMTDMTYDRRILLLALQGGRSLPTVHTNTTTLINSVAADPTAVSFAWARTFSETSASRCCGCYGTTEASFANYVAACVVALHLVLLPALYYGLGYVIRKATRICSSSMPARLRGCSPII